MSPPARPMLTQLNADARTMAKGAAENVGGAFLGACLSFALTLLVTHAISPSRFGLYAIALATVIVAQPAAVLGLDVGAVRFVALHAADGDEPGARGSFQVAFAIVALVSALLTVVLFWQAPWLAAHAFHKPGAAELMRLVSLALPALALTRVVIGALQGLGLMGYAAWVNPLRVLATVLATVPLLALGFGARGVALAFVPPAWAALAVSLVLLVRALPNAFAPSPSTWQARRMLAFSLPQTLTTMLLQVIMWTDMLVLGRMRAAAEVAVYAICQRLLSPAQIVSTATGQMFAPRIAAEDARGDRRNLGTMLKRVTYWNLAASIPVFALLLVIPGPLLHLFGSAYSTGATALVILAAGQLFNAATGPLGQVINMSGHPYITLANNAVVAALNVAGCLILIPRYGIVGAAASTTGAVTIVNVVEAVRGAVDVRDQPVPRGGAADARHRRPRRVDGRGGRCARRALARRARRGGRDGVRAGRCLRPLLLGTRRRGRGARARAAASASARPTPPLPRSLAAVIRLTSLLVLAAAGACLLQLGASAGTGPLRGSVTSTDHTWVCKGPVDLDSVTVTMTPASAATKADAIHLASGCTGRIGRLEVTTSIADGVKVAQGVHDLTVGGGRIRCLAKLPVLHQDGIQVMGGSKITITGLIVDCGRPQDDLINSNLFVNKAGNSTEPPADVVCDSCEFGGAAAHTVSIQDSVRAGVVDSTICPAKFARQTLSIGTAAVDPVNVRNRVGPCSGPLLTIVSASDSVTYGQPLVLMGWIDAPDPQPQVTVQAGGAPVATVSAGSDGAWQLTVRPGVGTDYTAAAGGATSPAVTVQVRPRLLLQLRKGLLLGSALAGNSLGGRTVVLERQRGGNWTAIAHYVLGPKSTVTISPRLSSLPARVRLSIGPTQGYLAAVSPSVLVPSA